MSRALAVFGITGGTGRAIAREAASRGWMVRGLVRPDSRVPDGLPTAHTVRGDFADRTRVVETVTGADAVCVLIGPRAPSTDVFCAAATEAVLAAMHKAGVRRLVCQTGAMIGPGNRTRPFEWMARAFARRQPAAARDRVDQERVVRESGLDWTIVKPPRLTDGTLRHVVEAGPSLRVGLLSRITRADLAAFILDTIEQSRHIGARVFVCRR